jgi:Ca2+-transporting ATPase
LKNELDRTGPRIGLTSEEAATRLHHFGQNNILVERDSGWFHDLLKILLDPGGSMLLVLGILYWIIGSRSDAIILFIAYVPITAVDVGLNIHSGKILKSLRENLSIFAKTYRDGKIVEIPATKLVPDDVIVLEEGIIIPADGILLEANHLLINESSLTGESAPIDKSIGGGFLAGTIPYIGTGLGKIRTTGTETEFGKIGKLIRNSKESKSPLRKKIDLMVRIIFLIALLISTLLFFLEWRHTREFIPTLITALTFGMSSIPEEFPIVFTLYLSLGAWRLSKRNVLVKSLPSVETLGGVDVICTDKTGTLTLGRFQLEEFRMWNPSFPLDQAWKTALMACEIHPVDPMEIPVAEKCGQIGISLPEWELIEDTPFDPITKMMSHRWKNRMNGETILAMKGALESILKRCELTAKETLTIESLNREITKAGKRVLAVARSKADGNRAEFIGLLVYHDPIRTSAAPAIQQCMNAGIEIKMITGDHRMTAQSVAEQIGLTHLPGKIHSSDEILEMDSDSRKRAYLDGRVFARFTPELKHELVKTLKEAGKIVAMTGDGINDAPALRLADIGISMGKHATDAARSAAKMVLIENDFSGVVSAVLEGRRIFSNLNRSFSYLISFHTPIILLTLIPPIVGWPPIMMPTHIILLELIVHPVSAFTFENLEAKTHEKNRRMLGTQKVLNALLSGSLLSIACMIVFRRMPSLSLEQSRAMTFGLICMGNAFFVYSECKPVLHRRFAVTVLLILVFTLLTTGSKPIANRLHLEAIGWKEWIWMPIISAIAVFRLPDFRPDPKTV